MRSLNSLRWKHLVASAMAGLLISMATASVLPRHFVSEAVVSYHVIPETIQLHPDLIKQEFSPFLAHVQNIAFSEQNLLKIAKRNNLYPNDNDFVKIGRMRRSAVMKRINASDKKPRGSICCWTLSFGHANASVAQRVDSDLVAEFLVTAAKTELLRSTSRCPGDCAGNNFQQLEPPSHPNHKTPPLWAFGVVGIVAGLALGVSLGLLRSG